MKIKHGWSNTSSNVEGEKEENMSGMQVSLLFWEQKVEGVDG